MNSLQKGRCGDCFSHRLCKTSFVALAELNSSQHQIIYIETEPNKPIGLFWQWRHFGGGQNGLDFFT